MAVTAVTVQALDINTFDADFAMTAATSATDGFTIDVTGYADQKLLIVAQNTAEETAYDITINKGDGIQAVSNLVKEVAAGKIAGVCVESGKFKNMNNSSKGKMVVIPENVAVEIAVIALP
jgi:hypothetical protein